MSGKIANGNSPDDIGDERCPGIPPRSARGSNAPWDVEKLAPVESRGCMSKSFMSNGCDSEGSNWDPNPSSMELEMKDADL